MLSALPVEVVGSSWARPRAGLQPQHGRPRFWPPKHRLCTRGTQPGLLRAGRPFLPPLTILATMFCPMMRFWLTRFSCRALHLGGLSTENNLRQSGLGMQEAVSCGANPAIFRMRSPWVAEAKMSGERAANERWKSWTTVSWKGCYTLIRFKQGSHRSAPRPTLLLQNMLGKIRYSKMTERALHKQTPACLCFCCVFARTKHTQKIHVQTHVPSQS